MSSMPTQAVPLPKAGVGCCNCRRMLWWYVWRCSQIEEQRWCGIWGGTPVCKSRFHPSRAGRVWSFINNSLKASSIITGVMDRWVMLPRVKFCTYHLAIPTCRGVCAITQFRAFVVRGWFGGTLVMSLWLLWISLKNVGSNVVKGNFPQSIQL